MSSFKNNQNIFGALAGAPAHGGPRHAKQASASSQITTLSPAPFPADGHVAKPTDGPPRVGRAIADVFACWARACTALVGAYPEASEDVAEPPPDDRAICAPTGRVSETFSEMW